MISAKIRPKKYEYRAFMSKLNILNYPCVFIFLSKWLRNVKRNHGRRLCRSRFHENFYEIPDCCFEAHDISHGNIAPFSPLVAKKYQFPSAPARAQMQFFCCKPEVTCPKDSYVTAGCKKSLLNTRESGINYFLLASIRFLLSQKYFDLQIWGA